MFNLHLICISKGTFKILNKTPLTRKEAEYLKQRIFTNSDHKIAISEIISKKVVDGIKNKRYIKTVTNINPKGNTMKKSAFKNYLFSLIDAEGYDVTPPVTQKAKINFFFNTFRAEYGYNISRMGERKALTEYLAGLPSCFRVPFYNNEILQIGERFGFIAANASELRQDAFLDRWFGMVAGTLLEMHREANAPHVYKTVSAFIAAYNEKVGGPMFDRQTMRFFGDTMKNFGLYTCNVQTREGETVPAYCLYRKKATKLPANSGYFFRADCLKRMHDVEGEE